MARALFASAALLASTQFRLALAQTNDAQEEMAFAVPRLAPSGANVPLPRPMAASEAARVRRVFLLQAQGDIKGAVAETARLNDFTLLGPILADRYLRPEWRGDVADLASWSALYPGLPDAPAVFGKLTALTPRSGRLPPSPAPTWPLAGTETDDSPGIVRNNALDRTVRERAKLGQFESAVRLVTHTPGLDRAYAALLQAELAHAQFLQNRDAEALGTAEAAFRRGNGRPALAAYVAGLSAWRLQRPDLARNWFEAAWRAGDGDADLKAGAAFWAARAQLRTGPAMGGSSNFYALWLHRAAHEPATFYGQIARQSLGLRPDRPPPPGRLTLGLADIELIDGTEAGHRAFALLQVEQPARAEAELRRLWGSWRLDPARDPAGMGRALVLVAQQAGLNDFASALEAALPDGAGRSREPGTLSLPTLRPTGGFRVDPALIYGLTRLESNFDASIVSPAGAMGLMQVMPVTAAYLAGDGRAASPATLARQLRDPGDNLQIGQRYLLFLAESLDHDLLRMLSAYNSGVGSFARWNADVQHMDDPLMFIESIPNRQTRAYVSRALTYTWLYAAQMRLPTPSLDDLAAGVWPRFTAPIARREPPARLH